jgi:glycosyltransferase involved in cell wall biosynthesis
MESNRKRRILCINPKGKGDLHELRAMRLTSMLDADTTLYNVDRRSSYPAAIRDAWRVIGSQHWDLIYQESGGLIGGLNLIRAASSRHQRYIISTGDPIGGYFHVTSGPVIGQAFEMYERMLYRSCAGFVGWTPYLTGAALKMGAKRAVTIEGAVALDVFRPYGAGERLMAKNRFGLDPTHIVCGVVGSLNWNPRQRYTYGLELVETLTRLSRQDVSLLIVGDGSGREPLVARIPDRLRSRVILTGRLAEADVVTALNAMDIGFITQTLDRLGSFRLTTKLPEYLACSLPVAMSPIPGFYDYASEAGWPLPAQHPSSVAFFDECASWLEQLSKDDIQAKAANARTIACSRFAYEVVGPRFRRFVEAVINEA